MLRRRPNKEPNYTVIALDGLFSSKQKTYLDELPPKWLAANYKHKPGCSFAPPKNIKVSPHQQRIQDIRKRKKKKRSRFSWKKQDNSASTPTLGSPLSSPTKLPTYTRHVPFNSAAPKTCWFDQFAKPTEDDNPNLYHDKVHFHLRQLAKQQRTDVLDRDKRSWWKASPYIERSMERGLQWKKEHFQTEGIYTAAEKRKLYMKMRPEDSGRVTMSSTTRRSRNDLEMSVMRSKTRRMVSIDPLQSGLPPPQTRMSQPAMEITRPNYMSISFLASSRESKVHSRNHKVQLQGKHYVRGSIH